MSTKATKPSVAVDETPVREAPERADEGVRVFRGLILMFLFYAALGFALWFAWHAWRHWHLH